MNIKEIEQNLKEHVITLSALDRSISSPVDMVKSIDYIKSKIPSSLILSSQEIFATKNIQTQNIFARTHDRSNDKPVVILGGHWDAAVSTHGVCPGADDNASSVAVVLEVARLYAKKNKHIKNYEIEFAFWCLEEAGLVGSYEHSVLLEKTGSKVHGCAVLESVGYFSDKEKSQRYPNGTEHLFEKNQTTKGDFYCVVGHEPHGKFMGEIQDAMMGMRTTNTVPIFLPEELDDGIDLSDHRSFHEKGFPAVMINDTAFFRNKNYHQTTDVPDTLNYKRMTELVEVLFGWLEKFD